MARVSAGLLASDDFSSLAAWTADASITLAARPTMCASDPFASYVFGAAPGGSAYQDGVREPQIIRNGTDLWLLLDGGDGTAGWRQFLVKSTDNGLTWGTPAVVDAGILDGSGGSYAAVATGWLEKRGSTFYLHRVTATSAFASPNVGLPATPYHYDIWTNTALSPTGWVFDKTIPAPDTSDFAHLQLLPGSLYYDGSTYHNFAEGDRHSVSGFAIGHGTSSSPDGPFTWDATPCLANANIPTSEDPENPKVFYNPVLARYFMLINVFGGPYTDNNILLSSATVNGWASLTPADLYYFANNTDFWSSHAIGVSSPLLNSADGNVAMTADGYVPIVYDADPASTIPSNGATQTNATGWHMGRKIKGMVLEPSPKCVYCTDTANKYMAMIRSVAHGNGTIEYNSRFSSAAVINTSTDNSSMSCWFRYNGGSIGPTYPFGAGTNGYRLIIKNIGSSEPVLQTYAGGVVIASVTSAVSPVLGPYAGFPVRIVLSGTSIKIYIFGVKYFDVADATYLSGTSVAFDFRNAPNGEIRNFHIRTSDTVTINGCPAGATVSLMSAGNLPIVTATASGSGVALLTHTHFPAHAVQINGMVYTFPSGLIYGGDIYNFNPGSTHLYRLLAGAQ